MVKSFKRITSRNSLEELVIARLEVNVAQVMTKSEMLRNIYRDLDHAIQDELSNIYDQERSPE